MAALLCQSVGSLFSGCCSGCGKVCALPCKACNQACKGLCDGARKLCTSHFCFYGTVTIGLNLPPIIFALQGLGGIVGCTGSNWLILNLVFCVTHILAALYIAERSSSWSEAMKVLCYDPWIAGYIVVGVLFFVWLCTGISWRSSGAMVNGNCPDNIDSLASSSIGFGMAFFFSGVSALFVSMLVSSCCGRRGQTSARSASDTTYKPPTTDASNV